MAWTMAGQCGQRGGTIEIVFDWPVTGEERRPSRLDDRQHAFAKRGACGIAACPGAFGLHTVIEVLLIEQIAGIGKGRHEAPVPRDGIPPDMINMEVGAEN